MEHRLEAIQAIAHLAFRSPRLLPACGSYERWLAAVLAGEIEARPDDAAATLPLEEKRRIVEACAELFPDELSELSARCDQEYVAPAIFAGSVAAGIRDRKQRVVLDFDLELIEEPASLAIDPLEDLAMVLDGEWLWGLADGREAEREIAAIPEWLDDDEYDREWHAALRSTSWRLATDWHRLRLDRLVRDVREQLPLAAFPRASASVLRGCERFAADEESRARLAANLLSDMLGREQFARLRALLAA